MGCTASKVARAEAKAVSAAQSSLASKPVEGDSPGTQQRAAAAAVALAFAGSAEGAAGVKPGEPIPGESNTTAAPSPRSAGVPTLAPAATVAERKTAAAVAPATAAAKPAAAVVPAAAALAAATRPAATVPSAKAAEAATAVTLATNEDSTEEEESEGGDVAAAVVAVPVPAAAGSSSEATLRATLRAPLPPPGTFVVVHTHLKNGRPMATSLSKLAKDETMQRSFAAACKGQGAHLHAILPGASGTSLLTLWELRDSVPKEKAVTLCATYLGTAKVGRSSALSIDESKGAVGLPASMAAPEKGAAPAGTAFFVVRMTLYDEAPFWQHLAVLHGNDVAQAGFEKACEGEGLSCGAFLPAADEPIIYAIWRGPSSCEAADITHFVSEHILPRYLGEVSAFKIANGDGVCGLP